MAARHDRAPAAATTTTGAAEAAGAAADPAAHDDSTGREIARWLAGLPGLASSILMTEQGTKPRRGCLFYTLVIGAIVGVMLLAGAIAGGFYAKRVIGQLTDTQPMTLPKVQLSDEQMDKLRDRVENFRDAVREGKPTPPLELTADELNALIENDPDLIAFRNHLYVTLEGDRLQAQMSFPAEDLGLDALRGKYVNATGVFAVALKNGLLYIRADSLSAKGKPLPAHVMRQLSMRNLADKFNNDGRAKVALAKLEDVRVENGKLVIVPKKL